MLYSINWKNFIVWLSLFLEILSNMCILLCLIAAGGVGGSKGLNKMHQGGWNYQDLLKLEFVLGHFLILIKLTQGVSFQKFIIWPPYNLAQKSIAIVFYPVCDVINYKINLIFLIKPFFLYGQKVKIKIQISWERNTFKMKQKAFFIIFRTPFIKANKSFFSQMRVWL